MLPWTSPAQPARAKCAWQESHLPAKSGPLISYDLADRGDRVRVYEQVLREGTEDDVRFYVDPDDLLQLWDDLVLPPSVREAWAD